MIIRLAGGLGNQMFQYAFGRKMTLDNKEILYIDTMSFLRDNLRNYELNQYAITVNSQRKIRCFFCNYMFLFQKKFFHIPLLEKNLRMEYEREMFQLQEEFKRDAYYVGYWQNEEYFKEIRELLVRELTYKGKLNECQRKLVSKIKQENSVAMHVRKGDYLNPIQSKMYVNLSREYYEKAMRYIDDAVPHAQIYIFSDDIKWCHDEFDGKERLFFVEPDISGSQHVDFELMRNCKHFILANSTFSWWASWLADNPNKLIIAPQQWYLDKSMNSSVQKALLKETILL